MTDGTYYDWREQLKAYMTAHKLDPGHLTNSQVDAVTVFARSLSPVKARLALIKKKHHADDLGELSRRLRMLVKDAARKLHTSNLRRIVERASRKVAKSPIK